MCQKAAETRKFMLWYGLGNPLAFLLSPGNDHDSMHAIPLLSQINIDGSNILGDKAYGAKAIRDYIDSHNAVYTIPPRSNINDPCLWTGIFTRSAIWLNASSRSSNGFVGYLRAMTNLMLRSWRLSTLLLLLFC